MSARVYEPRRVQLLVEQAVRADGWAMFVGAEVFCPGITHRRHDAVTGGDATFHPAIRCGSYLFSVGESTHVFVRSERSVGFTTDGRLRLPPYLRELPVARNWRCDACRNRLVILWARITGEAPRGGLTDPSLTVTGPA